MRKRKRILCKLLSIAISVTIVAGNLQVNSWAADENKIVEEKEISVVEETKEDWKKYNKGTEKQLEEEQSDKSQKEFGTDEEQEQEEGTTSDNIRNTDVDLEDVASENDNTELDKTDTTENITETESIENGNIDDKETEIDIDENNEVVEVEKGVRDEKTETVVNDIEIEYDDSVKFMDTVSEGISSGLVGNLNNFLNTEKTKSSRALDKNFTGVRASMPTMGDVRTLVFAVEFDGAPFEDDIEAKLKNMFWGEQDESSDLYPVESARAFYQRSSFGKLNLVEGDIFTYTFPHERSYYDVDSMIYEVIEDYKNQLLENYQGDNATEYVNDCLKQYDSNEDGIVDGIYIYYTGGVEEWGDEWWSYVGHYDGYKICDYSFGSTCILGHFDTRTIIHETGHMLGLGDYYDYTLLGFGGIFSIDMMEHDTGDHNAFSKMLLGWIEPEDVEIITEGIQNIELNEVKMNGKCLIIIPDYEQTKGLYTEFFMITYRNFAQNDTLRQYNFDMEGGLCIYHINAELNQTGDRFLYGVAKASEEGQIPLIVQLHADGYKSHSNCDILGERIPCVSDEKEGRYGCYFHSGDEFTPYTIPSTSTYNSSKPIDGTKYSGIFVNNVVIENGIARMTAGFEKKKQDYEVSCRMEIPDWVIDKIGQFQVEIYFSTNVYLVDPSRAENELEYIYTLSDVVEVLDEDGKKIGCANMGVKGGHPYGFVQMELAKDTKENMEYDKEYILVIPENTLKDQMGNNIAEMRITYTTEKGGSPNTVWRITEEQTYNYYIKCVDENGNGIIVGDPLRANVTEEHHMRIYQFENFNLISSVETNILQECLSDLGYVYKEDVYNKRKIDIWKAKENKWGIAIYVEEEKGWMAYIDGNGNILDKNIITIKDSDVPRIYGEDGYRDYDKPLVYDGYELSPARFSGVSDIFCFAGELIGMTALKNDGGNAIYLFDMEGECVYYGESSVMIDLKKYGNYYYMIEDSSVYCEVCSGDMRTRLYHVVVLDEKYQVIKKYHYGNQPIHYLMKADKGFIIESNGSPRSIWLCDNNFNIVDNWENRLGTYICYIDDYVYTIYPADLFGIVVQGFEATGYKKYMPYPDTGVENKNVVNLGLDCSMVDGNVITIPAGMNKTQLESLLKCKNYSWSDAGKSSISKDAVLEVSNEENTYSEYYYFEFNGGCTVSFELAGHGQAIEPLINVEKGSKINGPQEPTDKGYIFLGWYRDAEYTVSWSFEMDIVEEDMTLYAKWIDTITGPDNETYKVTFDLQGHGAELEEYSKYTEIPKGSTIKRPASPEAVNYIFTGWYRDTQCTILWNFERDTVEADITLYAGWESTESETEPETEPSPNPDKKTCKVTFELQGHGTALEEYSSYTEIRKGTTISSPIPPTAEGYKFTGWYKESDCKTLWDFTTDTVENDTILYAGWEPESGQDNPPENIPDGIWIAELADYTYTGKAIIPDVDVYYNKKKLTAGRDYTITYQNNTKAALSSAAKAPTVTVKGKGNFSSTKKATFTINKAQLTEKDSLKAAKIYPKGAKYTPIVITSGNILKAGTDYTLVYLDASGRKLKKQPTKVGDYQMRITGKGSCEGEISFQYSISESGGVGMINKGTATISNITYGSKEPEVTLSVGGKILERDVEYMVSFVNISKKGTATAIFIGIGDYAGTLKKNFKVQAATIQEKDISTASAVAYEKGGAKAKVTVAVGGVELVSGTDYTITYKNSTKLGTAKVTVKGKGNYIGSQTKDFTVEPKLLTAEGVKIYVSDALSGKKPTVTIYDSNGKKLSVNKDYKIAIDKTAHKVTVTNGSNGLYKVQSPITITYRELGKGRQITSVTLNKKASGFPKHFEYTGKEVELEKGWLTVKAGKAILNSDKFEILGYMNNIEKGTATIIIRGTEEYGGIKMLNYKIKAKGFL